jgi:hypothetical protein
MTVNHIGGSDYAEIYGLQDDTGKTVGTKEVRLAGADVKTYYDSWSHYTKTEIKKMFKAAERS